MRDTKVLNGKSVSLIREVESKERMSCRSFEVNRRVVAVTNIGSFRHGFRCAVFGAWMVFLCGVSGCGEQGGKVMTNEIISKPGKYAVNPLSICLNVSIDQNDMVRYSIEDKSGETVGSGQAGSKFSRWFFSVDADSAVWIYSGDIGTFVAATDAAGVYTTQAISRNPKAVSRMPKSFFEKLPESVRSSWADERSED